MNSLPVSCACAKPSQGRLNRPQGNVSAKIACLLRRLILFVVVLLALCLAFCPVRAFSATASFTTDPELAISGQLDALENLVSHLMPGDERFCTMYVTNKGEEPVMVWLSAQASDSQDLMRTAKHAAIQIQVDGADCYQGVLAQLLEGGVAHELVLLDPGAVARIDLRLNLPADLDNEYALQQASIIWALEGQVTPRSLPETADTAYLPSSLVAGALLAFVIGIRCLQGGVLA